MHLLQAVCPEHDQSVVTVDAEVCEVLQQPVSKLLVPCSTGAPCLGQHGVVGPVVANSLLTEHVLVGGAGGVPPPALLPRKLAFGVRQLKKHCSCNMDILWLVLSREVKSRGRILILYKSKPVCNGFLEKVHSVPVCFWFKAVEQVLAAVLEQAAEVEWDEELGPQRVAIQVTGQCKRTLQNRDE